MSLEKALNELLKKKFKIEVWEVDYDINVVYINDIEFVFDLHFNEYTTSWDSRYDVDKVLKQNGFTRNYYDILD